MKQCKICERTKIDFGFITLFHTQDMGLYTWVSDICKSCANDLKNDAVRNYESMKEGVSDKIPLSNK